MFQILQNGDNMKQKEPLNVLLKVGINQYKHYCPACDQEHTLLANTANRNNQIWSFNDNLAKPTFYPDFMTVKETPHEEDQERIIKRMACHYWIQNGKIIYTLNGNHSLIGKTIDMIPYIE